MKKSKTKRGISSRLDSNQAPTVFGHNSSQKHNLPSDRKTFEKGMKIFVKNKSPTTAAGLGSSKYKWIIIANTLLW